MFSISVTMMSRLILNILALSDSSHSRRWKDAKDCCETGLSRVGAHRDHYCDADWLSHFGATTEIVTGTHFSFAEYTENDDDDEGRLEGESEMRNEDVGESDGGNVWRIVEERRGGCR